MPVIRYNFKNLKNRFKEKFTGDGLGPKIKHIPNFGHTKNDR